MAGEPTGGVLSGYDPGGYYCEMTGGGSGTAAHTAPIRSRLAELLIEDLRRRARDAERELFSLGITFTVYSQNHAIDRILPFDVIPRVLSPDEWARIESGLVQRVTAINLFLHDVYHRQNILGDGVVPRELVLGNTNFRPEMIDLDVPFGTYAHVCGIDIVRDHRGEFWVLEAMRAPPRGFPT